ncbi:hypothetical protein D3C87_1453020 [compost metagenome]
MPLSVAPADWPWVARYRSTANTVMPMEPNGTRPISTVRPDSRSHSRDPTPMPIENIASSSVTTFWSPPSTSRAKLKKAVRNVAPRNQSQEMPSRLRNTTRRSRASIRLRHVSVSGFQLMRRSGWGGGETGTPCDTTRPATAITTQAMPT